MRAILAGVGAHPKAIRVAVANVAHAHAQVFGFRKHPKALVDGSTERKNLFDLRRHRRHIRFARIFRCKDDMPLALVTRTRRRAFRIECGTILKEGDRIGERAAVLIGDVANRQNTGSLLQEPILGLCEVCPGLTCDVQSHIEGALGFALNVYLGRAVLRTIRQVDVDTEHAFVHVQRCQGAVLCDGPFGLVLEGKIDRALIRRFVHLSEGGSRQAGCLAIERRCELPLCLIS